MWHRMQSKALAASHAATYAETGKPISAPKLEICFIYKVHGRLQMNVRGYTDSMGDPLYEAGKFSLHFGYKRLEDGNDTENILKREVLKQCHIHVTEADYAFHSNIYLPEKRLLMPVYEITSPFDKLEKREYKNNIDGHVDSSHRNEYLGHVELYREDLIPAMKAGAIDDVSSFILKGLPHFMPASKTAIMDNDLTETSDYT
jgi:hypothetical protein